MKFTPSFSIVINTLNRATELQKAIQSLLWLKYDGRFEVIVVNGPSTDDSENIIASWGSNIRAGKCELANLSVSRNIGICMAQGDIVAFIDDDAIPEPEWLSQMAEAYQDPIVGAVGGLVYNHTGYEYQYKYCTVDRFGNADLTQTGPTPHLSFPKSGHIPHLLGCNSSFRRSALLEIGGFDEEFEYFLDETDVCMRIVDAGYLIAQLPHAYVHHKFAPSNIRTENKVTRHRYPIIKNKIYFMLKHAREFYSLDRILSEQQTFIQNQRNEVQWALDQKLLSESDSATFHADVERALEVGLKRGIEGVAKDALITPNKLRKHAGVFQPFPVIGARQHKVIVLVSRDFPPNHGGGIATFNKDLAEGLAAIGHLVHVVTQSPDINRVDFENGVWVHRMEGREMPLTPDARKRNVPQHIWNWSAVALEEVRRIATHRPVDVVEAPIWDCEGVALLLDGQWPLVTSLQTTLHFWLASNPTYRNDGSWMASFGFPMLELEKELMRQSHAIRSISSSIRHDIEAAYGFSFDEGRICIAHLGMPFDKESSPTHNNADDRVDILFVGRLESRKGIDILLAAIPEVLTKNKKINFVILGDDTQKKPGSQSTYKEEYLAVNSSMGRVTFEGRVSNERLRQAYRNCDIFVAPSRFESFGLVFLEAMREGKPVIGCAAGGMPEIIADQVNGFLVPPGDTMALTQAIMALAESPVLRKKMGDAGKKIFLEKFTSECMSQASMKIYETAGLNFRRERFENIVHS